MTHGWVTPRPDKSKEPCGGPGRCAECTRELTEYMATNRQRIEHQNFFGNEKKGK